MKFPRAVITLLALGAVSTAGAAVVPIGQFAGDSFEGFEAIGTPGSYTAPVPIFNGDVTMADTFANNVVIAFNLFSNLTNTEILPYNGNLMGLSVVGHTTFTFTTPATEFGGFINTADDLTGSTITIYDTEGQVLLSEPITIGRDAWVWHGWSSTTPIGSIDLVSDVVPGKPLAYDDLEVNFVPEPTALSLLLTGVAMLLLRRR